MVALSPVAHGLARPDPRRVTLLLALGTLLLALLSLGTGAAGLGPTELLSALTGEGLDRRAQVILWDIRLPRLALGLMVGAALAVSGALMQGLFRNPLADPGIVGVGAGAGLGAVLAIVLGGLLPAGVAAFVGAHLVPLAAFLGGWVATLLLYRVATRGGRTSVATMLLAGIALGALAGALTGILVYLADDRQLRDLTFWGMGSLAGASWPRIGASLPLILPVLVLSPLLARGLNALALGEAQAAHMGIAVERVKRFAILGVAAAAGAAVAVAGGIGFVGIVVPHLLRLLGGPDHRHILPQAALLGGGLLVGADMIARSLVAPAELPIGIVTACLGAPVFLWILLRRKGGMGL
ncbi:iron complex transport system permease protein [Gemmobacter caeni]|jgi:iron complex transport system permease protein|uniref:Iron complex transport system permease protein n=2 Tax=Gemmobacter TaxID=204456 RepID=A0A2T6ANT1_9RHOB|nr:MULTISPECIES: iron ABC transporter permease [Gemmobacter]OJY36198.1 MAG: iron ABC transporter [Rhodobacterales bacterium 65-51]PTX45468.1 iron complex transport system permease protein [Gemmobacter caeni]TWI93617.1 iron complex transport system permease protein [Gemmobacter caeni]GHC26657.1 heme ABC transporter permease [Gemmobacter nanjingensis]